MWLSYLFACKLIWWSGDPSWTNWCTKTLWDLEASLVNLTTFGFKVKYIFSISNFYQYVFSDRTIASAIKTFKQYLWRIIIHCSPSLQTILTTKLLTTQNLRCLKDRTNCKIISSSKNITKATKLHYSSIDQSLLYACHGKKLIQMSLFLLNFL